MLRQQNRNSSTMGIMAVVLLVFGSALVAAGQTSITTFHYNNDRTGWNNSETVLTPANVGNIGLLWSASLNDQVDAQPLVVSGVAITAGTYAGATRDVVYVATESNAIYAYDAHSGTLLLSALNFAGGPAVPQSALPGNCNNNGPNVGINSTPVIDLTTNTLYVITYVWVYTAPPDTFTPTYYLHALDLGSLLEKANSPIEIAATHTLSPAGTYSFNAQYQRQRPALLLANGNIYAGFGSFCDNAGNLSRGWLLGWSALSSSQTTIEPLPSSQLLDYEESAPGPYYLSSVWMSGNGPAADDSGNVLFVTGNSESSSYTGTTDIQESVIKVSSNLASVVNLFTPYNWSSLDKDDYDFGAGGVMVLPDQPGSIPHLAVAAGKVGGMYLMNEDVLGGYSSSGNNVLGTYAIGNCWCGESYYVDPTDGLARVVTSAGTGSPVFGPATANTVEVWKLATSPSPSLTEVSSAQVGPSTQDPGFFTSVSSNGTASPIIWALSRPANSSPATVDLFAFNPDAGGSTMTQLLNVGVGTWPNVGGNANLVPVVANGEVFVGTYQELEVLGLSGFSLSASPSTQTVAAANTSSVTYTVDVGALLGFTGSVALSVTGCPSGATCGLSPTSVSPGGTSTLTISGLINTPLGPHTITIKGTGGGQTHSIGVTLLLTFALSVTPSTQTVGQGSTVFYPVTVPPAGGYTGNITLQVSGTLSSCFPSCPYTITGGSGSTALYVSSTSSTAVGTYKETVTATSGSLSQTASVSTVVQSAGFSLSLSPIQQNVAQGQNTTFTVTVSGGICKPTVKTALAFANLGYPLTGTFNPTSITACGTSTLTVGNTATGTGGMYFLVTGTNSISGQTDSVQGEVVITK